MIIKSSHAEPEHLRSQLRKEHVEIVEFPLRDIGFNHQMAGHTAGEGREHLNLLLFTEAVYMLCSRLGR